MKAKKIMGIALLAFAIGQVSMAEKTDPNIERLLKIAKLCQKVVKIQY